MDFRLKRDLRLATLFMSLGCASVVLLTAWQIWTIRQESLRHTEINTLNLARALNTHTEGVFKQCELLLLDLGNEVEADGTGPAQLQHLSKLIALQKEALPQVNSIALYDERGDWLLSSQGRVPAGTEGADRDFFSYHREHPGRSIYIGEPIRSRTTGDWVISVSQRLERPDGSFAGVVAVGVSLQYFLGLYRDIEIGKTGAIGLTTSTGRLLVRYPFDEKDIGLDLSGSPLISQALKDAPYATASYSSKRDGTPRIYAFVRSDRYALVTGVAMGRDEALQSWQRQALQTIVVVALLLAILGLLGRRLVRSIRQRIRSERQLRDTQKRLLELNQELEALASQDSLTGLANRRHFDEYLEKELLRSRRDGSALSLLLVDVDYFKAYNDHYGHPAGDRCLQQIADILRGSARRPADLVARYGGEELALVLPETDAEGARHFAEQLLVRLRRAQIPHAGSPFRIVTASFGVATVHADSERPTSLQLIDEADRCLYQAKQDGRNRWVMALAQVSARTQ